jgi:hypothetical protein
MGFLSILSKVVQIGGSLLSQYSTYSANSNNSIPNTTIGNVTYTLDPDTRQIHAANFDLTSGETSISYSRTSDDGQITTAIQPLPPGKAYDASDDIKDFGTGGLALVPSVLQTESVTAPPSMRQILTSIPVLFAAKVFLTSKVSFNKTSTGFEIESQSILDDITINYEDKNGKSFSISGRAKSKSESNAEPHVISIPFAPGSSPDFPFRNLAITISMPTSSFEEMTFERRKQLLDISQVPHLKMFYNSFMNKALS